MGSKTKITVLSTHIPILNIVYMVEAYIFDTYPVDKTITAKDKLTSILNGVDICSTIRKFRKKGISPEHISKFPSDIDEIYYYDYKQKPYPHASLYNFLAGEKQEDITLFCRNTHSIYFTLKCTIDNTYGVGSGIIHKQSKDFSLNAYQSYEKMLNALTKNDRLRIAT